jgi:hypothetical protein
MWRQIPLITKQLTPKNAICKRNIQGMFAYGTLEESKMSNSNKEGSRKDLRKQHYNVIKCWNL